MGFKVGYDHKEDTGGILVTKGEVMHHQIDPLSSTKAKNWFITNAEMILQRYETTKKKGIFVVTKTYTAKERAVALLMSKEISVSFGVDVDLASIGKIAPEVGWWRSQKEEVWKLHQNVSGRRDQISMPCSLDARILILRIGRWRRCFHEWVVLATKTASQKDQTHGRKAQTEEVPRRGKQVRNVGISILARRRES